MNRYAITIVIAFACLASGQQQRTTSASPPQHNSPMAQLQAAFAAAKRANADELLGTWMAVKEVWTQKFLTGGVGPDKVKADENGIRRPDVPGRPLEWKLTFSRIDGSTQATSEVPWVPTGDSSDVKYEPNGDFTFEKDYGGDAMWIYRCRAASSRRIVCLFKKTADGHGIEFRKVASPPTTP